MRPCAALFQQGGPTPGAAQSVRVRDLFDRLVRYRNDEMGHGATGMRPDAFYDDMADSLLEALPELFGRLDVLAGRRLVYVSDVSRDDAGRWVVEQLELVGETERRAEPFILDDGDRAALPVPRRLYLRTPVADAPPSRLAIGRGRGEGAGLIPLHPLVLYHETRRAVYFLNVQRGREQVEFLDYLDAGRLQRDDLAGRSGSSWAAFSAAR